VDTQVVVRVEEGGSDGERLQELAQSLRSELLELDVTDVTPLRGGEPPPGARAIDAAAAGALLVVVKGSLDLLDRLVSAVRSWLGRRPAPCSVEVAIGDRVLRVSNASPEQQERLIAEFLHTVARG
jgi:hypothetical protein